MVTHTRSECKTRRSVTRLKSVCSVRIRQISALHLYLPLHSGIWTTPLRTFLPLAYKERLWSKPGSSKTRQVTLPSLEPETVGFKGRVVIQLQHGGTFAHQLFTVNARNMCLILEYFDWFAAHLCDTVEEKTFSFFRFQIK